jgi:hypothetical protein
MLTLLLSLLALAQSSYAGTWNSSSPEVLNFSGQIVEGEFSRFEAAFTDQTKKIIVDSPGGLITEGLAIGKVIASKNIAVEVQGICMSSCANYLFLAAKTRILNRGVVGFHGNRQTWVKFMLAQLADVPGTQNKKIWIQIVRASMDLNESATDKEILDTFEEWKTTAMEEAQFFKSLGISQALFDRASLDDKGMNDGKFYMMLLPTNATFAKYGVHGVEGEQSQEVIHTDARIIARAKAGQPLLVD